MSETAEATAAPATPVAPAPAPAAGPAKLERVVAQYIQLRDAKKDCKAAFDAQVVDIDAAMAQCEAYFLKTMRAQGLTSLPTGAGTPYQSSRTSVRVVDPALYFSWVLESPERSAFQDIKANKTAVVALKEEHQDLPPGLDWHEEIVVNVRR